MLILLAAAVAVGAAAQRSTGIGFSLVVTPVCAAVLLPDVALGTVARLALVADVAVLLSERSAIDWTSVRRLLGPAILAVPVGVAVGALVPSRTMVLGASAVILAVSLHLLRTLPRRTSAGRAVRPTSPALLARPALASSPAPAHPPALAPSPALGPSPTPVARTTGAAGFAAGFLGVTTGMSGAPLAFLASRRARPLAEDRASMVVLFLCIDVVAAVAHPHSVPVEVLAPLGAAIVAGLWGGTWLSRRVADHRLRAIVVGLVVAGAGLGLVSVLS